MRHRHDMQGGPGERDPFGAPRFRGRGPGPWDALHAPPGGRRHGGRPPFAGGGRARRGDIRLALLVALLDGPGHGYELIGRIEARSGGGWRPSAGSVYPTLQLLQDEELVTPRDDDGRRIFELTERGREAADEAAARFGEGPFTHEGAEGQLELRQAGRLLALALRQVAVVGDDAQLAEASKVVNDARQKLYGILAAGPGEGGAAPK